MKYSLIDGQRILTLSDSVYGIIITVTNHDIDTLKELLMDAGEIDDICIGCSARPNMEIEHNAPRWTDDIKSSNEMIWYQITKAFPNITIDGCIIHKSSAIGKSGLHAKWDEDTGLMICPEGVESFDGKNIVLKDGPQGRFLNSSLN